MWRGAARLLFGALAGTLSLDCLALHSPARGPEQRPSLDLTLSDLRLGDDFAVDEDSAIKPSDDSWAPSWNAWQRNSSCDNCQPPRRVAIAFRGDYHRRAILRDGVTRASRSLRCSDFFNSAKNLQQQVVDPLVAAGSVVKTYFHSYVDANCSQRDQRVLRELNPTRHEFSKEYLPRIVDSFIKVLELVLQDKDDIDAVVLTRFDLRYRAPITSFNIDWGATNVAHKDLRSNWEGREVISDVFYVLPIGHVQTLIDVLNQSADSENSGGAGHWIFNPFVKRMGRSALNYIDKEIGSSTAAPSQSTSFVGISRNCGAEFDTCPDQ